MFAPEVARRAGLLATEMRALLAQLEQVVSYHAWSCDPTLQYSSRCAARTGMGKGSQEATCLFKGVRALLDQTALLLWGSVVERGTDPHAIPRAHLAMVGLPHPDIF